MYGGSCCKMDCNHSQNNARQVHYPYSCCGATIPVLEPLVPVPEHRRRNKSVRKPCVNATKKKKCSDRSKTPPCGAKLSGCRLKCAPPCPPRCAPPCPSKCLPPCPPKCTPCPSKCPPCPSKSCGGQGLIHPDNCCCFECEKKEDCEAQEKDSCESSMEEKNLCNFLADNPELKNCKPKKEPPSDDIDIACDSEVWLLQCPKNFDPNDILNCVMCPPKKGCGPNVDCCADRFKCKKALVVIAPEKAADLELLCDNMKLVKPIGKIVVTEKCPQSKSSLGSCLPKKRKSKTVYECCSEDVASSCSGDDNENEDECSDKDQKTSCGKKIKKKLNDQRFTIETTVTVKNCSKKKGKKGIACGSEATCEQAPTKKKGC